MYACIVSLLSNLLHFSVDLMSVFAFVSDRILLFSSTPYSSQKGKSHVI